MRGVATGLVARGLAWTAERFYAIERTGPPAPEGPLLVVANHPNVFLDAFVIFHAIGRPARPLVKASHFGNPPYRLVLAALGALPVHRRQDDPTLMHRNEDTFRAAIGALHAGDALQIYPEGVSHSEPALAPLRTGAARIALRAESEAGWRLGLRVVPVGLTYSRKTFFRGRALAAVGEPFAVTGYERAYLEDPVAAARELTAEITGRLEAVTLNLARAEDMDLIDTAERLYAREKGWAGWREREGLGERLPRLQAFAEGLAWLRANDPVRHERLARRVRRYRSLLDRLGAEEGEVPPRTSRSAILRFVVREGALLLFGLPLAVIGIVAWYVPYRIPGLVVRVAKPVPPAVATWKLASAIPVFGIWYAGLVGLAAWREGWLAAVVAGVVLPDAGLVALAWTGRWERDREEVRLFLRALGGRRKDRLAGHRRALAAEFDRLLAERAGGP